MAETVGRLAAIEGTTTTWKTLYKPGASIQAVVNIKVCNRAAATRTIRIAQVQSASTDPTPADGEMLVYDTVLYPAGDADDRDKFVYERICLNNANNDQVCVYASGIDVDFNCDGVTGP